MPRLSIARSLLLALLAVTLALAVVAALSVASLYDARRGYEDALSSTYAVEVAASNLLTAAVVEESILRSARGGPTARDRAQLAYEDAVRAAHASAEGDARSLAVVEDASTAQERAREAAIRAGPGHTPAAARRRNRALDRATDDLRTARAAAASLAGRQPERRRVARDRTSERTDHALTTAAVAGVLALAAALAFVWLLVAGMRRPLSSLVGATRKLAGGDLRARAEPSGPSELQELSTAFNVMATDVESARQRVEAGRLRLATVIESLGDALVICDGYGRVTQVNPRVEVLMPDVQVGRSVKDGPLPPLEDALDREVEIEHGRRTLAVTASRMGAVLEDGVVFTIRDTTERARLERAKSDFVATASHELRSPLTSIKGFVELLRGTELADRQREFVDIILLSTNRLVDLVNDLLDVARVEAGQLEIQRRPIAVEEAVREVVVLMQPRFEERSQDLRIEVAPALPAAWADPARVRQIVTNLLTNAHLYTPDDGHVTVSVGAEGDQVRLSVADDGRGMTADQVERVFDRFYRSEEGQTTGTGLGLAIVYSLVELHEGSIDIVSAPGEGTTVTVKLPRAPSAADMLEPRQALHGRRVLVIEDEPEVARLIEEQLRPHHVEVTIATSGTEAVKVLKQERFDAVTLDILLGGMDGFEVLRTIRQDPAMATTPVIVVSVMAGEDTLAAEWSVSKPIDAEQLTDAIGSAILAGRARVLVLGRDSLRGLVGPLLERRGIDYAWATSAAEAARLCEETHFEVALVDAGMRSPHAALAQLDLRGRRLRRSVVVFSTGDDGPGLARLDPDPVPIEDATQAVVDALRLSAGVGS